MSSEVVDLYEEKLSAPVAQDIRLIIVVEDVSRHGSTNSARVRRRSAGGAWVADAGVVLGAILGEEGRALGAWCQYTSPRSTTLWREGARWRCSYALAIPEWRLVGR